MNQSEPAGAAGVSFRMTTVWSLVAKTPSRLTVWPAAVAELCVVIRRSTTGDMPTVDRM